MIGWSVGAVVLAITAVYTIVPKVIIATMDVLSTPSWRLQESPEVGK
jgi:hypothetical protein